MTIVIDNVLNPSPAVLTDEFVVTIGPDTTASSAYATVQLNSDNFTFCSITFSPNSLNKSNSIMIVSAKPQNPIPSTGYLIVTYPSTGYWTYDLALQQFPTSNATCSNGTSVSLYSNSECKSSPCL